MHAKRPSLEPRPLPVHAVSSSQNPAGLNQASSASVVVAASGFVLKRDLRRERQRIQNSTYTDPWNYLLLAQSKQFVFTCQGQELGEATSPPTTLPGKSSRYLDWGTGPASAWKNKRT